MVTRRGILVGGGGLCVLGGGIAAARWFNVSGTLDGEALSVTQAHAQATAGMLLLIDIRRPDEWTRKGVGAGAIPLDVRDPDFVAKLRALVPDLDARVALICARGVRSRGLAQHLGAAGFTQIIDVPEGMMGSGAGPGWIAAGLPVVRS
jgi:rhodanese-related sulfurtransferase